MAVSKFKKSSVAFIAAAVMLAGGVAAPASAAPS